MWLLENFAWIEQKPNYLLLWGILVELRGIEPLTSAVRLQRSPI